MPEKNRRNSVKRNSWKFDETKVEKETYRSIFLLALLSPPSLLSPDDKKRTSVGWDGGGIRAIKAEKSIGLDTFGVRHPRPENAYARRGGEGNVTSLSRLSNCTEWATSRGKRRGIKERPFHQFRGQSSRGWRMTGCRMRCSHCTRVKKWNSSIPSPSRSRPIKFPLLFRKFFYSSIFTEKKETTWQWWKSYNSS